MALIVVELVNAPLIGAGVGYHCTLSYPSVIVSLSIVLFLLPMGTRFVFQENAGADVTGK